MLDEPCPVFTFTQIPINPKIKNILVPLDISEGSLDKLPLAITISKQLGATLHILSAAEHQVDVEQLQLQLDEMNEELIEQGISVIKNEIHHSTLEAAINLYVKDVSIDLVMIMSRPGFRWSDLWISPKAKRLISHSNIPVMSIRSNKPLDDDL